MKEKRLGMVLRISQDLGKLKGEQEKQVKQPCSVNPGDDWARSRVHRVLAGDKDA